MGLDPEKVQRFPVTIGRYDNVYGKLKDTVDMNTTENVNHDFRKLIEGIKATS